MIALLFSLIVMASTSASPSAANPRAQEILDRVINTVSTQADQLRRTYVGKIKTLGTSSIVLSTSEGDRTVVTNDVTTYFRYRSGTRSEISFSKLTPGAELVAMGTIDPSNLEMNARQIIAKVHRYNLVGTIQHSRDNIFSIKEFNGPTTDVDFSGALSLKKNLGTLFIPAKISDFKVNSMVFVIGYSDQVSATLSALKADIVSL